MSHNSSKKRVPRSSIFLWLMMILFVSYFGYEVIYIFPLITGTSALILNWLLLGAEMLAALFSIYLYHSIFCTMEWKSVPYGNSKESPLVTIQIPTFNEPVEILEPTLKAASSQNYKNYEIIVADDSTETDKENSIRKLCKKYGAKFIHRKNRGGFKAGALNAIAKASKGDILAILDADDTPTPDFISHGVDALVSDKNLAFVQTRNAERNDDENLVTGIGRLMRDLFFGAILKSKDMRNLAIFCGSGGLIRKSAYEKLGGWPEDTVTEDIDFSTMAFADGMVSRYINPVAIRGLLPASFSGFCGQTLRWSYGTTRTLILRWKTILKIPGFWRKIEHFLSCMTYILGPAILIIDLLMVAHLIFKIPIFHMYEASTVWIFGAFLTLSAFLALLYVQIKDGRISLKRIIAYILAMYGLSINFTIGVVSAIIGRKLPFFRTPKESPKNKNYKALAKRFWPETLVGAVSIAAGLMNITNITYAAQSSWVILFGVGFLVAPYLAFRYG